LKDLQAAASTLGINIETVGASNDEEIESVFTSLPQRGISALLVTADGFLISRRDRLVALAAIEKILTMYPCVNMPTRED
jgi:hypothetical protein